MSTRRSGPRGVIIALVALALIAAALIFAADWTARENIQRAKSAAIDIANRLSAALQVQPRIVVHNRTIVEQRNDVLKLVTTEESFTERRLIENSWLHSTKTLEIEADFVVQAGLDLTRPFTIDINPATGALHVILPPAEIFSTELRDVRFLQDMDGLWNHLTPDDRESAIRELRLHAARRARESDLAAHARSAAELRIRDLLATENRPVTFAPPPPPTTPPLIATPPRAR